MKSFLSYLFLGCQLPFLALGLFEEDAGVLDFLIATTGHGRPDLAVVTGDNVLITTDTKKEGSSCYVAGRDLSTGETLWRRNVCAASTKTTRSHATAVGGDRVYTVDDSILRAWTAREGSLVWEKPMESKLSSPRLWTLAGGVVAVASGGTLWCVREGELVSKVTAPLEGSEWFHLYTTPEGNNQALVGRVDEHGQSSGRSMAFVDLNVEEGSVGSPANLGHSSTLFQASSLLVLPMGGDLQAFALAPDGRQVVQFSLNSKFSQDMSISQWHPLWTSMERLLPAENDSMIRIVGRDNRYSPPRDTMALFRMDEESKSWVQWYGVEGEEETQFDGVLQCSGWMVAVASQSDVSLLAWKLGESADGVGGESHAAVHRRLSPLHARTVSGDKVELDDGDVVVDFTALVCKEDYITSLLTAASGKTQQISFQFTDEEVQANIGWASEEGLSQVSSAVILDASHLAVVDAENDEIMERLKFFNRLQDQYKSAMSLFSSSAISSPSQSRRDHIFGFVKVAVLLSKSLHRLWGVETFGDKKRSIRWTFQLPQTATWHTMIHGTANSPKSIHGINGGTHSHELLVLSTTPSEEDGSASRLQWTCLDGTIGSVHSEGSVELTSNVLQVSPIFGGGKCRQGAIILHEDRSVSVVPDDEATVALAKSYMQASTNGFFSHIVDSENARLESVRLAADSSSFSVQTVGQSSFSDEEIVSVVYPLRDEMVQSPCAVLGDESLLLKYLNPHLALVITRSTTLEAPELDEFEKAIKDKRAKSNTKKGTQKRKPAGASPTGETAAQEEQSDDPPNLFVNLVDSVSGRVLYRASHANAAANTPVPALITENWVFYAFVNEKTRRTELGVLTLHEGMIHSKGLTAFTTPDQSLSFSSLDARDSKPVVLAKTYLLPRSVSAIGTTITRAGISDPKIIFATSDNQLVHVDRHALEPRRPSGELKETEKAEGLHQYFELIPLMSLRSLSYNLTVEAPTTIVSTSTALESQSLVLAFGGPDIFFTRTSPSRGFDLLPDSFNRVLLSMGVGGLLIVLIVVKSMASKKIVTQSWA